MYCKVCNTRLGLGTRTCQNCGSDAGPIAAFQRPTQPGPLPSADLSTARDESLDDEDDEEVVELDDVTGEIPEAEPKAAPAAPARSTSRPGTTKPIVKSAGRRAAEKPAAKNAPRGGASSRMT